MFVNSREYNSRKKRIKTAAVKSILARELAILLLGTDSSFHNKLTTKLRPKNTNSLSDVIYYFAIAFFNDLMRRLMICHSATWDLV